MLVTALAKKVPKSVKKMNQALGLSKDAEFLYDIVDIASNKVLKCVQQKKIRLG